MRWLMDYTFGLFIVLSHLARISLRRERAEAS